MISKLLINRNYALLWTGQAISSIGDYIFLTTLILWVGTQLGKGQSWAPIAVSGVALATLVPQILVGPLAGVFVDRWDKRRTMLAMDVARAALVALLLLDVGSLPIGVRLGILYVIVVLVTASSAFFTPSRIALIGDVVSEEDRGRAGALGQMTLGLAAVVGPPIGAPLLIAFGVQWALIVNAISFLASFSLVLRVRTTPAERKPEAEATAPPSAAFRELATGLRFFAGNRTLITILVSAVVIMLGAGALDALDIFFVTQNLHTMPSLYGWLSAALGVGTIAGGIGSAVFSGRINPGRLLWLSMFLSGIGLFVYSRLSTFVVACVVLFLTGMPVAALNGAIMPLLLAAAPKELVGRVAAVINPAVSLASIASIALSGVLVSTVLFHFHTQALGLHFGPIDTVFSAAGVMILIAGTFALLRARGDEESRAQAKRATEEAQPEPVGVT